MKRIKKLDGNIDHKDFNKSQKNQWTTFTFVAVGGKNNEVHVISKEFNTVDGEFEIATFVHWIETAGYKVSIHPGAKQGSMISAARCETIAKVLEAL